jgi:hypothetical protein
MKKRIPINDPKITVIHGEEDIGELFVEPFENTLGFETIIYLPDEFDSSWITISVLDKKLAISMRKKATLYEREFTKMIDPLSVVKKVKGKIVVVQGSFA